MAAMSYRRRQQLHRAARRAAQPGRLLVTAGPAGRRPPVLPPAPRTGADGEPGQAGDPSPRQGLDWARRIELISVLVAALVGVASLWHFTNQVRQELTLTKERQITDRCTKAVDNLGDDAVDVRLGGVYALQRIVQDSLGSSCHRQRPGRLRPHPREQAPEEGRGTGRRARRSDRPRPPRPRPRRFLRP